jgi:hypothetical protein
MHSMSVIDPTFQRFMDAAQLLKGLSDQAEIARQLNVLDQHLTNWKKRGLPKPKIMDLADWLGCDPYWLRDGIGEMKPIRYSDLKPKQMVVLKAMEKMSDDDQSTIVKISNTLAKPNGENGDPAASSG